MIVNISGRLKIKRDFTCTNCGRNGLGTTITQNINVSSIEEIDKYIKHYTNMGIDQDFPIGWASFYPSKLLCNKCLEEQTN